MQLGDRRAVGFTIRCGFPIRFHLKITEEELRFFLYSICPTSISHCCFGLSSNIAIRPRTIFRTARKERQGAQRNDCQDNRAHDGKTNLFHKNAIWLAKGELAMLPAFTCTRGISRPRSSAPPVLRWSGRVGTGCDSDRGCGPRGAF